ncbi:hypothetical protein Vadar_022791 [Vaccinium darrowii]|uniref:Uncharacterized protein n=1 Tax=Vaccinium darrowii TaxID=229202 RepID=A0ACB7XSD2_9ERIC|nr:hypothetical protein Vadar_022791 [Vaccinium darrowii]
MGASSIKGGRKEGKIGEERKAEKFNGFLRPLQDIFHLDTNGNDSNSFFICGTDLGIRDSEARGIKSKKDTFGELQIVDYSLRQDGEVESFKLIPVADIANVIRNTEYFKPNCNLVIMDFLFRHRFIRPEQFGYLKLLQSLRSGDCS